MESSLAVAEDLLVKWLSNEIRLAQTCDDRLKITELLDKAVKEKPLSVKIWQMYLDWLQVNYNACHGPTDSSVADWSEEDNELCRDLFTWEILVDTLTKAIETTQWRLDESHVLWNRWATVQLQILEQSTNDNDYTRIQDAFMQRFRTPHLAFDETQAMFWPVVQKYQPEDWESAMTYCTEMAGPARKQASARQEHEANIRQAIESGDETATYQCFEKYLSWEKGRKPKQRSEFDSHLRSALYERALLQFPTVVEWWIEYIDFYISGSPSSSALSLIERATLHCPWSGDLWAMRILRSDVERKSHPDIEATKHLATSSGLLEVGGVEELSKVLQQWCNYLRRLAFRPNSSEDHLDTAEVGILMALEDIQQADKEQANRLLYPLQNIQIKFYTEGRRFAQAREIYRQLAPIHGNSAEFWARYYQWELWLWAFERLSEARRVETQENGPHLATAVLQEALAQRNLDSPERVIAMYLDHFQLHESSDKVEAAMIKVREVSRAIARRRQKEVAAAHTESQDHSQTHGPRDDIEMADAVGTKRKASFSEGTMQNHKRIRNGSTDDADHTGDQSTPVPSAKRDRENNTIVVRNLPTEVQELDIKKFFRDIDQPVSIEILRDSDGSTSSATVEFASHDDVLSAKTRNGKLLAGREVQIQGGSQATLYVTNYPPSYDESKIRALFASYGEIVSIRFPSLKFNSRRRFCYVTFLGADMAKAAEDAMDGKLLDNVHKLVAKISNPDAKKQRSGAQAEGREIFIKNLDFKTTEEEVKQHFSEYGNIVSMHLLKTVKNKLTGSGFVVYSSSEEAQAALAADNKPFKDRILHVEVANTKNAAPAWDKARKTDIIVKHEDAALPTGDENGRRVSDVSMASAVNGTGTSADDSKTVRERSAAVFNLPDTVNDVRIRNAMEQYGQVVKIQLRRREAGAIVEFSDLKDAFNVRQGVDCSTLGSEVKTGDVADLLSKQRGEDVANTTKMAALSMRPGVVMRPTQARGGRRGGLGVKRGGIGSVPGRSAAAAGGDEQNKSDAKTQGGGKSNADFRAMLEQSRGQP